MEKKFTIDSFGEAKINNKKISMVTAYDYSMAQLVDRAGIDVILVGDSLGMVVQGMENTLSVTVEDIIYHTKAVKKATKRAFVIADMPFLSYHVSDQDAVKNAGNIIKKSKADAIKLEGGKHIESRIKSIIAAQIPVMGHLGLTPQSINIFGGFKVQGKQLDTAKKIVEDAIALEKAGVFAITLEGIPDALAQFITEQLSIPTIGIGASKHCDGQVLVINDLLGIYADFTPKFVKKFANLQPTIDTALKQYIQDIDQETFPDDKHTYTIDESVINQLKTLLK